MDEPKIKNCAVCNEDFNEATEGQDLGFGIVGHTACIEKAQETQDEARKSSSSSSRPQ